MVTEECIFELRMKIQSFWNQSATFKTRSLLDDKSNVRYSKLKAKYTNPTSGETMKKKELSDLYVTEKGFLR